MSTAKTRTPFSGRYGIVLAVVVLVSLAYAVMTANVFLWISTVAALGFSAFVLYLFYRLVVAVERIADRM